MLSSRVLRGLLLALASGALYWSAFPPTSYWPLAFVAWVPLLVALHRQTVGRAFVLGWVQGVVMVARAPWIFVAARALADGDTKAGVAGAAAFAALHAIRPALLSAAAVRGERAGWPVALTFPFLHAATEAFVPAALPWYTASQLAPVPVLMQGAAWLGAIGVGGLIAAVNGALAAAWLARAKGGAPVVPLAVALSVPVLMTVMGALAERAIDAQLPLHEGMTIAAVQPGGSRGETSRIAPLQRAIDLTRALPSPRPPLAVWPETVLPEAISDTDLPDFWSHRLKLDRDRSLGLSVLGGALVKRHQDGSDGAPSVTNSALLYDANGGFLGAYDKRHPIAFGETVPFGDRLPWLRRWFPSVGHIDPGRATTPLLVSGHLLTTLICYEDLVPDLADESVDGGSELLIDISDDGWFGHSGAWENHLAAARYRAIEHGRYLVRSGHESGTAIIDPAGRVVSEVAPYAAGVVTADVRWIPTGTLYDRIRRALRLLLAAVAVTVLLVRVPRRWRVVARPRRIEGPLGA